MKVNPVKLVNIADIQLTNGHVCVLIVEIHFLFRIIYFICSRTNLILKEFFYKF